MSQKCYTKARILALLESAGSNGVTVKEIAEKLNLSRPWHLGLVLENRQDLTIKLSHGYYSFKK
jgi:DNA-binding Lrp family transcriptional regulator